MNNPLDPVREWYGLVRGSLDTAERAAKQAPGGVADAARRCETTKRELARLTVFDLTTVFERALRDSLAAAVAAALPTGPPFGPGLRARVAEDLEVWKFKAQLIDSFGQVDAAVRGQAKQIVDFRDWVAHGRHTHEPAPVRIEPDEAYRRLTKFLKAAGIVT